VSLGNLMGRFIVSPRIFLRRLYCSRKEVEVKDRK